MHLRPSKVFGALALSTLGCVPDVDAVRLPVSDGAPHVVIVAYGPGSEVRAAAYVRPNSAPPELSVPVDTDALYAADYTCAPDTLGLELPLVPSPEGVLLPEPTSVRRLDLGGPVPWVSIGDLSDTRLGTLRLRGSAAARACAAMIEAPATGTASWLLAVRPGYVLAGRATEVHLLDDGGGDVALSGLVPPIFGAAVDDEGGVWVMTATATVHLTLEDGVVGIAPSVCAALPCPVGQVWMAVVGAAGARVIYALDDQGALLRIDVESGARQELARAAGAVTSAAVVPVDGGALVLGISGDRLQRVRGTIVDDVLAPVARATALARVDLADGSSAVLAAANNGEIFRYEAMPGAPELYAWTSLGRVEGRVDALAMVGGTLVAAQGTRGVSEARADGVTCAGAGRRSQTLGLVGLAGREALRLTRAPGERVGTLSELSVEEARARCATP